MAVHIERTDEAMLAAAKGKSTMPKRGSSTRGAPWHEQRPPRERNPYPFAPRGSVATAAAAAEPSEEENDWPPRIVEEDDDDEELEPRGVTEEDAELFRALPPSQMTVSDWEVLDARTLRAPTPDQYAVFPRDDQAVELLSLKELIVGGFPGMPEDGPHNCVIWCHDNKGITVGDMKDAFNHFAILACIRYVEKRDVTKAKVDLRNPMPHNGKLVMAHYISKLKEHRIHTHPTEIMIACSEVIYNEDAAAYTLVRPHYVRLGLLHPFVGAEIGCWIRRHHLVERSLGHRKDHRGHPLTLRIAVGATYDALLVLCPYLCLPRAEATHVMQNAAVETTYTDPFLLWLFWVMFLLAVIGLVFVLYYLGAKLYQMMKPTKKTKDAAIQCTLPLAVIYIAPTSGTRFHMRKQCIAHLAKEVRELHPCKTCCP